MQRHFYKLVSLLVLAVLCGCTAEATFSVNGVQFYKKQRERDTELQQLNDRHASKKEQLREAKKSGSGVSEMERDLRDMEREITSLSTAVDQFRSKHVADISDILVGLFGTPDEPAFPQLGFDDVIDTDLLVDAAGPVRSDQFGNSQGLYREHCAHCHGTTGDGRGPTAEFLNPYPRDYRMGLFKFKTTSGENPPTHDDLKYIIAEGISDTAMPAFKLLSDVELDALVNYVKYLSIRGQVERTLMDELSNLDDITDENARLINVGAKNTEQSQEQFDSKIANITAIVTDVASRGADASEKIIPVPARPWKEGEANVSRSWGDAEDASPIEYGRSLFYGNVLKCTQCHGLTALGDGELGNYDKWTDDWSKDIGIKIADRRDVVDEFVAAGALPPRTIQPRNLRQGFYRGGHRPMDLYLRIKNGITGTPMPAVVATVEDEQIWAVVEYVRSLPYETISRPEHMNENTRRPGF